ncbi:Sodium/calcium exchanger protein-domain-containing protein [Podospora appendiculata]|uniref:Vacuolar calcium ion transporter n=1 Tax=Podospora appendiculata TaxID=314037 RepID=A0AAE0X8Q3_9PEZI|nr:Sodium/calcium exchanger protein-domain-containing protein [Podospora appendiculata]
MSSPVATTGAGEKRLSQSSSRSRTQPQTHQLPLHQGDVNESTLGPDAAARAGVDPKPAGPIAVRAEGESGRSGIHPASFLKITLRSSSWASRAVNILWPAVPAALAVRYARPEWDLPIFILAYIAMVPCANLIGFAAQGLAQKLPHVWGVLAETTLGSLVEIILFMVLITRVNEKDGVDYIQVIRAAILGSVLATMLLCLGLCFIAGGIRRDETSFSETVSEAGSGLLLTAGFGLAIPTVFQRSLMGGVLSDEELLTKTIQISRSTAVLLIIAYLIYVFFQARTHHGIYDVIFEEDSKRDADKNKDAHRHRLTLTECILALAVSIALVAVLATILVDKIHYLVEERNVSDAFVGLILVPLVEKAAEHLTAVDEAWDNQMNFALSHVLGATLQTALFNGPLVVIVGWGLDKNMGLNFETFDMVVLILAILTVGNFLRDQKSNYLEGSLLVIVYVAIAVAAAYYPKPVSAHEAGAEVPTTSTGGGVEEAVHRLMF